MATKKPAPKKPAKNPAKKPVAKKPLKKAGKSAVVKKKAPSMKAKAGKAPVKAKKPVLKKVAPKPSAKKPGGKPAAKPLAKAAAPAAAPHRPKPISIVVSRRSDREPSVFMRSNEPRGPGGIPLKDAPKPVGLDRSRLGALQGKIFAHVTDFEDRQKLAHMVSDVSVEAGKPRIQRSAMLEDLKKIARIVKNTVNDPAARESMLNDLDAFGAVVRGGK